jgi:hypothetical protein
MSRLRNALIVTAAAVISAIGTHWATIQDRASFQELPKAAQTEIIKEHDRAEAIYKDAENAIAKGDYSLAIRQFKNAEQLLATLQRIDPDFKTFSKDLANFRQGMEYVDELTKSVTRYHDAVEQTITSYNQGFGKTPPGSMDVFHKVTWLFNFVEASISDRAVIKGMHGVTAAMLRDCVDQTIKLIAVMRAHDASESDMRLAESYLQGLTSRLEHITKFCEK